MTTATPAHPALRGHPSRPALRGLAIPGEATGTFWLLASVVTVLNMIGLLMVLSASSVVSVRESGSPWSYAERQLMWTALGVGALALSLWVSVHFWRRCVKGFMAIAIVALAAVLVPGVGLNRNGATRWLAAGPIQVQPSEFAKLALLLFVADLLARRSDAIDDWKFTLLPVTVVFIVIAGLVMAQPNLGTTIIIAAIVLTVAMTSGIRLLPLGITAAMGVAAATLSVYFEPFRRQRLLSYLDPMGNADGVGLQNVQSLVAMANGGLLGRGLGRSTVKWGYLPFAWTDFIFAVIGEEFGLVGALAVVGLFVAFAVLGTKIAMAARTRFEALLAVGITAWITVQAFMNIAAVISIMPITGVPLPFVSFGGSALCINMAAVGILLNIARRPRNDDAIFEDLRVAR